MLKAPLGGIFERDAAAREAEAQNEIAKTAARMALSQLDPNKIDPVEERSKNVHIDYLDDDIRNAIIDKLAKMRDDILADDPAKPLEPGESARKQYLNDFFKDMPKTYFFRAVAEGLNEEQLTEMFTNAVYAIKKSGFDPAVELDDSVKEAPLVQPHDERLDKSNDITRANRTELLMKTLPIMTNKIVKAFEETLPIPKDENDNIVLSKARYDVDRFNAVTKLQLDLLIKLHADKAYVENSYKVHKKSTNMVIRAYFRQAAKLLAECVKTPEDKELVIDAMEQSLSN